MANHHASILQSVSTVLPSKRLPPSGFQISAYAGLDFASDSDRAPGEWSRRKRNHPPRFGTPQRSPSIRLICRTPDFSNLHALASTLSSSSYNPPSSALLQEDSPQTALRLDTSISTSRMTLEQRWHSPFPGPGRPSHASDFLPVSGSRTRHRFDECTLRPPFICAVRLTHPSRAGGQLLRRWRKIEVQEVSHKLSRRRRHGDGP